MSQEPELVGAVTWDTASCYQPALPLDGARRQRPGLSDGAS